MIVWNQHKSLWGTAPAISILAKFSEKERAPLYFSKVQDPHWTPFCYTQMNKHKNGTPTIYAAEDILQMYTEFNKKRAQASNKMIS